MGKLRHLKRLRRDIRAAYAESQAFRFEDEARTFSEEQLASLPPAPAVLGIERGLANARRRTVVGPVLESIKPDDARNFFVGMRVSGPPEAFGLPPDPGCAAHATGTPGCADCYPPRAPMTVTAVDPASGTITLSTFGNPSPVEA
jgi:hypothetical protein